MLKKLDSEFKTQFYKFLTPYGDTYLQISYNNQNIESKNTLKRPQGSYGPNFLGNSRV